MNQFSNGIRPLYPGYPVENSVTSAMALAW